MDLYLPAARTVIDHLTKDEFEDYTKKGLKLKIKIPASWKRWKAMGNLQKIKFINRLFILSPEHASNLERSVAAINETTNKATDAAISINRTMHEYARTMHVMSSSDNLAAISKAFGRYYTWLELNESKSKLHEDLETSVVGWKELACMYNDKNIIYGLRFCVGFCFYLYCICLSLKAIKGILPFLNLVLHIG